MTDDALFPAVKRLAEYEIWCNEKSLEAASTLDVGDLLKTFPLGFGTIHRTLFHTVNVFRTWSACVAPQFLKPEPLRYDPALPLDAIASLNRELSEKFIAAIDASHAAGLLALDRRIEQVFHLVTHGTHHRTQFITMLRLLGKDSPFEPGDFGGWSRTR